VSLDHTWIASHIPHQGSMCLLEQVDSWDGERIHCRTTTHRRADNPLRAHGRLGSSCGIEYAAQAMAVHGALLAQEGERPKAGYLTSVRSVAIQVPRLDDIEAPLEVEAERLSGDDNTILYGFSVRADGRLLLEGRATVVLNVARLQITGEQQG
jgi:predicted hotdog family 3-hydroxylacyl-ACP dehydratase